MRQRTELRGAGGVSSGRNIWRTTATREPGGSDTPEPGPRSRRNAASEVSLWPWAATRTTPHTVMWSAMRATISKKTLFFIKRMVSIIFIMNCLNEQAEL